MKVERKGKGTGRKKKGKKAGEGGEETLAFETEGDDGNGAENSAVEKENRAKASKGPKGKGKPKKDKSGAVVEEGEALFQGFRVAREDQKRLQQLEKNLKQVTHGSPGIWIT